MSGSAKDAAHPTTQVKPEVEETTSYCLLCGADVEFKEEWYGLKCSYVHANKERFIGSGILEMVVCPKCWKTAMKRLREHKTPLSGNAD